MGKIAAAVAGLVALLVLLAAAGAGSLLSGFGGGTQQPNSSALSDIPPDYLILYREAAATCPGLPWSVLAAIGKVESDHGRSTLPGVQSGTNSAGAAGPMQFLMPTFNAGRPPNPATARRSHPAVPRTTRTTPSTPPRPISAHPAPASGKDIPGAIKTYNHADWYVAEVLTQAQAYVSTAGLGAETAPGAAALEAINYAQGPDSASRTSGAATARPPVTSASTAPASRRPPTPPPASRCPASPRPSTTPAPMSPPAQALEPGDLVFYGTPTDIHHVGLYIGGGQMIDAPRPGKPVRIERYRYAGDGYAGATRPTE